MVSIPPRCRLADGALVAALLMLVGAVVGHEVRSWRKTDPPVGTEQEVRQRMAKIREHLDDLWDQEISLRHELNKANRRSEEVFRKCESAKGKEGHPAAPAYEALDELLGATTRVEIELERRIDQTDSRYRELELELAELERELIRATRHREADSPVGESDVRKCREAIRKIKEVAR